MKSKGIRSRSKVVTNAEAFAKEQIREEAHHFCRLESTLASTEINLPRSETEFDEPKEIELSERKREKNRERGSEGEKCVYLYCRRARCKYHEDERTNGERCYAAKRDYENATGSDTTLCLVTPYASWLCGNMRGMVTPWQ